MRSIELSDNEVQLWWASLDVSEATINRLRATLTPGELERADRFRVTGAGRRFIAARAGLRSVLETTTGIAATDIRFRLGSHGKPYLADGCLLFNASDSGDFVAVALAEAEVGVDIELKRSIPRRDRLAHRICTVRELEQLERAPEDERDERLLRLWTCKEAALKAVGTGLPGGVRNVDVEIPADGPPKLNGLIGESDGWSLLFADLHQDVLCSVVVRGTGWRPVVRPFSLEDDGLAHR
jgi:4'-phosphopantetheinyl transferase